jgi:hypothetical protein
VKRYKEKCPMCGLSSMYDPWLDRYFHKDGSSNQLCWFKLVRGEEPSYPQPENDTGVWENQR